MRDDPKQHFPPPSLTTEEAANEHAPNQGEQSVSGSTPVPESDDDTLANAQAVGTQLGEDEEHPQEVNIGQDMNTAEDGLRGGG